MGKKRIVAETGAGQHGVASATACALLGLECVVYMGAEDMARQALNVFRMRLLGAEVRSVDAGSRTLKDAINEAMRDWVGAARGHALPARLGARAASVSADGARVSVGHRPRGAGAVPGADRARCPTAVIACVGGGSNAIGIFDAFIDDADGAADRRRSRRRGDSTRPPRRALCRRQSPGVLQGTRTFVLQDDAGNIELTHSVSAGLDYAAVGPEHAWLHERGRAEYHYVSDDEALDGVPDARAHRRHSAGARVVARHRLRA